MTQVLDFVAQHGLMLLGGITALLFAGTLASAMQRSPAHRQRLGEIVIASTLLWIIAACIPLPRWQREVPKPTDTTSIAPFSVIAPVLQLKQPVAQIDVAQRSSIINSESVVPRPINSRTAPFPLRRWLAATYLAGAALFGMWLALGHLLLWRMLANSKKPDDWLAELFGASMTECGVRRARLRITCKPTRPFSFGLLGPTVILDAQTAAEQHTHRLRQIFRHELAHLRRRDARGNALFNLAMVLLYFHPLYWWLRSRTFLARELVADAQAAAASDRLAYASDLLALANSCRAPRHRTMAAVGMFIFTSNLSRRIAMLAQPRQTWQTRCSPRWYFGTLVTSAAGIIVMSLFLGVRPALAQTAQETSQEAKKSELTAREDAARADLQKLAADHDQAAANLAQRQAELLQAQAQLKATEAQLQALQKQLADTNDMRPGASNKGTNPVANTYDVRLLENQLKTDQVELDRRSIDLKRKEELYQKGAITSSDMEQARYEAEAAKLKVSRDEIELERAQAGLKVHEAAASEKAGSNASAFVDAGEIDPVNLATAYANAVAEVRVAKAELSQLAHAGEGVISSHDRTMAEVKLQNAMDKAQLLRQIAQIAADRAKRSAEEAQVRFKMGILDHSEMERIVARSDMLNQIVQTKP